MGTAIVAMESVRSKSMMYERNGVRVGMSHLPDHKRPVLAVGNEHGFIIVASFSSERTAEQYENYMRTLLYGLVEEQEHEHTD